MMKPFSLRRELWIVTNTLLFSLLLLPAAVYVVGSQLFGTYASGVPSFYFAFLRSLIQGQLPALILTLGPTCGLFLARFVLRKSDTRTSKTRKPSN